jgi:ADP-heptose:LPS heptosyltransferase
MKSIDLTNKRIIISRTDSIGDVMLTLPLCAWIKNNFKGVYILFLGNSYTKPVVESFAGIDEFVDWKEFENLPTVLRVDALKNLQADSRHQSSSIASDITELLKYLNPATS